MPRAARLENQKRFWDRLRQGGHVLLVAGLAAGVAAPLAGQADLDAMGSVALGIGVLLAGAGRVGSWWTGRNLAGVERAGESVDLKPES